MPDDPPLPPALLAQLVAELEYPATLALALTGSYARDAGTAWSDVDLLRFVATLPEQPADRYTLRMRAGRLISLSTTTIDAERGKLERPEQAVLAVVGLRQARILLDLHGALAELLRVAVAFTWEPLREAADAYASDMLMGLAEEAHKLLGGLARGDEPALVYASLGMLLGLTRAVTVQRGLLVESDNTYFQQLYDAVGQDAAWTRLHRLVAGLDPTAAGMRPAIARSVAGLHLYRETAAMLDHVLRAEHRPVIDSTLAAIGSAGLASDEG